MDPTYDDADLRRAFGPAVLGRGSEYAVAGRVRFLTSQVDDDGDLDVRAAVAGSGAAPYSVSVSAGRDHRGFWAVGRCSCPVGRDCKHAAAALLAARALTASGPATPAWERQLGSLIDELDERAERGAPLALQVELRAPVRWGRQPASYSPSRGHLVLRPLHRGASGRWIKTGIGWHQAGHLEALGYDARQAAVLGELALAHGGYASNEAIGIGVLGARFWSLLERLRESGIELVPGGGLESVVLAAPPARLRLDLHDRDDGSHVRLGVQLDEEWWADAEADLLGDSHAHGVALWREGERPGRWSLQLARLERPAGPALRRLFGEGLVVPAERRDELLADYLPQISRHLAVTSADGSVPVPETVEPRLALTVTWASPAEVSIAWSWRYRVGGTDRVYALDSTLGARTVRRADRERAIIEGLDLDDDQVWRLCGAHRLAHGLIPTQTFRHGEAVSFAEDVLPRLLDGGQVEVEEQGLRPDYREAESAPTIAFATRDPEDDPPSRPDWLDLEVVVTVDGHQLGLATLVEALTLELPRVVVGNGVHVRTDHPGFAQLKALIEAAGELAEQPTDGVRMQRGDLGLWEELAEIGLVDEQAVRWTAQARALVTPDVLPEVVVPDLKAELRSYQREGLAWLVHLWEAGLGGILADDMGLGKTVQTLGLILHARARGAGPFLVVAPTSVVSTWAHEAESFAPGLRCRTVTESQARRRATIADLAADADLVVTSYTLLRLEADAYQRVGWGGLVLDEAQTVKNHQGKTHQSVRRLDVPFRLALTGTPMENRLMELWALLSIAAPGLYPWPQRFRELVADPVEKEGDAAVLARFRRRIAPFLLRRTKDLVAADLPPKQEQVLDVPLTPAHRTVYDTHLQRERQHVLGLLGDFDRHRVAIFRSLTRLRQLSLDAALVDPAYDGLGSAKLDLLVDHLVEVLAEGHRALVFSQFTRFLARVRDRLEDEEITVSYLDGRTRRRREVIEEFKGGAADVFLISLKAGGVGLTLTEADYVFVLDPWWNPAVEAQAVDRAHRIGQERPVMVYRLVSSGTIEEKVMELKARKAALFDRVLGAGADALTGSDDGLSADDIRDLLA